MEALPVLSLFEKLPYPCLVLHNFEGEYRFASVNEAALRFTKGLDQTMRGQPATGFFHEMPDILDCIQKCQDQGGSIQIQRNCHDPISQRELTLDIQFTRFEEDWIAMSIFDLTRDPPAEGQKHLKGNISPDFKRKNEFLAQTCQRLFSPLNEVLGLGQMLKHTQLNPSQREYLEKLNRTSHEVLDLASKLMDFSALETGLLQVEIEEFELSEVLSSAWDSCTLKASQKGLTTELHLEPDLPRTMRGDAKRLHQVLEYLLENAVRFTISGQVSLSVHCQSQEGLKHLEGVVSDTGIGIAADRLGSLFQPDPVNGPGLGLVLCQELMQLMGGTISVRSIPNQGSQFSLMLPIDVTHQSTPLPSPDPALPKNLRILVVDDHDINRLVAIETLRQMGFTAKSANSGSQAIAKFKEDGFDLIFMDIQMPSIDGYETAARIRAIPGGQQVAIIALTANSGKQDMERSRLAGMDAYLEKPINPQAAAQAIHTGLQVRTQAVANTTTASIQPQELPNLDFNRQAVLDRIGGNTALFEELMGLFMAENENSAGSLRALLESGQIEAAAKMVHNLKGSAGNLALGDVARISREIELDLKQMINGMADASLAIRRIAELESSLRRIKSHLRSHVDATRIDAPTVESFDLKAQLGHLAQLLETRNFRAETACRNLRPVLEKEPRLLPLVPELSRAMVKLDYASAGQAVRNMLNALT